MIVRTIVLAVILVLLGTWAYADECNSVRYSDNGDGTVTDCRTGLIWLKDAHCLDIINGIDPGGYVSWYDALKWVAALEDGLCGLTDASSVGDWRLPTKIEWMAMLSSAKKQGFLFPALTNGAGTAKWTNGDIFNNVQTYGYYWSSTTTRYDQILAWEVYLVDGSISYYTKTGLGDLVWPVRGGQSGEFGSVYIQ